jgi:hypothetical protein
MIYRTLLIGAVFIGMKSASAVTVVDLTTGPNASGEINGALFFATDQQPAGTGFIDSFLRVQNKAFEQGYNTDGGFPFDDKHPHNFQHSLQLTDLTVFDLNGTAYFKLVLDSNQNGPSMSSGGFEEWTAAVGPGVIAEPNVTALIMVSCGGFMLFRRRARS